MRLSSRKFLLALGAFITFIANDEFSEAMGVVLAYMGVEGYADIMQRRNGSYEAQDDDLGGVVTPDTEDEADTTEIIKGDE